MRSSNRPACALCSDQHEKWNKKFHTFPCIWKRATRSKWADQGMQDLVLKFLFLACTTNYRAVTAINLQSLIGLWFQQCIDCEFSLWKHHRGSKRFQRFSGLSFSILPALLWKRACQNHQFPPGLFPSTNAIRRLSISRIYCGYFQLGWPFLKGGSLYGGISLFLFLSIIRRTPWLNKWWGDNERVFVILESSSSYEWDECIQFYTSFCSAFVEKGAIESILFLSL